MRDENELKKFQRELNVLFSQREYDLKDWIIGKIPKHMRRCSVPHDEMMKLAVLGASTMSAYFGLSLFFTQALIVGAIVSGKYKTFNIITPSQYGKSFILGRTALYLAYMGHKMYVCGASANTTEIIMNHIVQATAEACQEIRMELLMKANDLERLQTTLSKKRIAFKKGGFVEAITLGDSYSGSIAANKAVGRGGDYIVDEAALVSDNTLAELGRREFANITGEKYMSISISNPHQPGTFYDNMTKDNLKDDEFVLWIDALTCVEEERFTEDTVFESEFAQNKSTLRRYLICDLDSLGDSMFDEIKTYRGNFKGDYVHYFLGIDAAYKGKDNICMCLIAVDERGKAHIDEITTIYKKEWIDGVTSEDIISDIVRVVNSLGVSLVCVDIGYGVWLVEGLKRRGVNVAGINFGAGPTKERVKARHYSATNASNKRAEMHLDLQSLVDDGGVDIEEDAYDKIKNILPFVTCERRASGKIQVIPKSDIKAKLHGKSPDELDSVLLGIHASIMFTAC